MNRLLKSLAVILLLDGLLLGCLFALLQPLVTESLCASLEANKDNCSGSYLTDLAKCLDQVLLGVLIVSATVALAWIAIAYLLGDSGTPTGLRAKNAIWWVCSAVAALGCAALGYIRADESEVFTPGALAEITLLSGFVGLITYFLTSVFATPWVIRGQVPGAHVLAGHIHFP